MLATTKPVPPYGRRAGFVPRRAEDFGAGGAFPEVHVPQYPLSMGLRADPEATTMPRSNVPAVTVDAHLRVAFGEDAAEIVSYSSHADNLVVPRIAAAPDQDADDEYEAEAEATCTARTQAALQAIVYARLSAVHQPASVRHDDDPTLIRYRPARQSVALNSGAEERIVRVEHAQEDPVLPPKHKRSRRVPGPAHSPPVATVMHSPPRPVSRKDMSDWKVPPSVSDWKNSSGYSVPLDKRAALASDGGRRVQEQDVQVSGGFAGLSEALCVAEQKAREAVETRVRVRKELGMKAAEQREQALREIAKRARAEAAAAAAPPVDAEEAIEREERRRQREYERRLASGKKSRTTTRDGDRDVSERIALGMASAGAGEGIAYDERLFSQDMGMESRFAADDDRYNVYSGRLFAVQQPALSSLMVYRPNNKHGDSDMYGGGDDEGIGKRSTTTTGRFKPDKVFSGALERPAVGKRDRPVEFGMDGEYGEAHDDPLGELDQYMAKVKEGKKR